MDNNSHQTKYILDSGDPDEYREIADLMKKNGSELWGGTTNPSLIAKKLAGQKVTPQEAFSKLQKDIVLEILDIVPGAVSAEVYADEQTTADQMIEQGREIAAWHERVVVKLPTTLEGLEARTQLRKEKVAINNTLVFSQEQIFAICLHEQIIQKQYGPISNLWPPFISPFVGRVDDAGENGMDLIANGMEIKSTFDQGAINGKIAWMLESSIRRIEHIKWGLALQTEIMTTPAKIYREWFALTDEQKQNLDAKAYTSNLQPIPLLQLDKDLLSRVTIDDFMHALETGKLSIDHPLTQKGIARFAADWKAITA